MDPVPASARRLSLNALPLPTVLVVGDADSYFSIEAWTGVQIGFNEATLPTGGAGESGGEVLSLVGGRRSGSSCASEDHQPAAIGSGDEMGAITWERLEPVLEVEHGESAVILKDRGWERCRRPATRRPVPLQLTHEHEPDNARLHEQIRRALDLFDVWGVIATASAGQVEPVRAALEGIDVPLLVTTDSTTVGNSEQPPNELRLMPSNRAQARAMLSTAVLAYGVDRINRPGIDPKVLLGQPRIAYSQDLATHAREYANDLVGELRAEAAKQGLSLDPYDDRYDYDGPLIVVGYTAHALELLSRREPSRLTILSDGCATKRVHDAVGEQLPSGEARYWFITRPQMPLRALGRQAYSAMAEAGRELLTSEPATGVASSAPETSRRDRIKRILHETDATHFGSVASRTWRSPIALVPLRTSKISAAPPHLTNGASA
jgi:hypothetical protein